MRLNITLTRCENEYLEPRLPLEGELEIWEHTIHNDLSRTQVFRVRNDNGTLSAPVEVKDIDFVYTGPSRRPK